MTAPDGPDLHALRAFVAIVRHGTVTAAGRELGLTQPATSRLLAKIERHTLVLVVGHLIRNHHRRLRDRHQTLRHRGHRDAIVRMEMHHRASILARHVYRAVDGESGRIYLIAIRHHDVAIKVDLHQIGSGDFVEHQAVGVD